MYIKKLKIIYIMKSMCNLLSLCRFLFLQDNPTNYAAWVVLMSATVEQAVSKSVEVCSRDVH